MPPLVAPTFLLELKAVFKPQVYSYAFILQVFCAIPFIVFPLEEFISCFLVYEAMHLIFVVLCSF
jgi:hypothetical protein